MFGIVSLLGTVWAKEQSLIRKGVIKAERVNFRETPDLAGTIIKMLAKNTEVTIVAENTNWYRVCLADGLEGWVAKDYVVPHHQLLNRGFGYTDLISFAKNFLRTNYRYGGISPTGFDCSGFTKYIFGKFGFAIPHKAAEQEQMGTPVLKEELLPGDLVFFTGKNPAEVNHVGIYIGPHQFIHAASNPGAVCISSLRERYYQTHYKSARRIVDVTGLSDSDSLEPEVD
jgi:cell wall-associated NlpC family hydrolase